MSTIRTVAAMMMITALPFRLLPVARYALHTFLQLRWANSYQTAQHTNSSSSTFTNIGSQAPAKGQRDEWMLVPPSSDDWSSRVDPTKLKNRKFNTGKGAKAPPAEKGDKAIWTETADEKRARLEREVMGIQEPGRPIDRVSRDPKAEATAAKIREHTVCAQNLAFFEDID